MVWSHMIKILEISDQWILSYFTFNIVRSSSTKGHLHFEQYSILIWSPNFKFKIWVRSDQRLLRLSFLIFWGLGAGILNILHLIVHLDLDKYMYVLLSFLFVLTFRFVGNTILWVLPGFHVILSNTRTTFCSSYSG